MPWTLSRPALAMGAALAIAAFAPVSTVAQTASARPTASPASTQDAAETAGPRRRPTRRTSATFADTASVRTVSDRASSASSRSAMLASTLRLEGQDWLGIPYRWGGTSRRGIDCSAFTQQFVRATMGIELPRATAGQQYEGVGVSRSELLPGDLVFFRRRSVRHVGVYLGGGDFIHASSSRGVTVSNLDEGYYDRHYWMSRRILTDPSGRRPTPRASVRDDSSGVRG